MGDVTFESNPSLTTDDLVSLYRSVGWSAYTEHPAKLAAAVAGSSFVVVARRGARLVGLARAISDDTTICYLQDVVVAPFERRKGIARIMVSTVIDRYQHVGQKVLLTDDEPGQRLFYESLGYTDTRDVEGMPLVAFVRFDQ